MVRLAEVRDKLVALYSSRIGASVSTILSSSPVDSSALAGQHLIQIVAVEPFREGQSLNSTSFYKNIVVDTFISHTPFTLSGKSHGTLVEQYKTKSFFKTRDEFPGIHVQSEIIKKWDQILCPIENVAEDVLIRNQRLKNEISPLNGIPDIKTLGQFLGGSVCVQVNAGAGELCNLFLSPTASREQKPHHVEALKRALIQFFALAQEALVQYKKLATSPDHSKLLEEFEKGYQNLYGYCSQFLSM